MPGKSGKGGRERVKQVLKLNSFFLVSVLIFLFILGLTSYIWNRTEV